MKNILILFICKFLFSSISVANSGVFEWPAAQGGNGHLYAVYNSITDPTWNQAEEFAESLGGYLVTITSEEENQFVFQITDSIDYWTDDTNKIGPFIGGKQTEGELNAGEGWTWITGEPFTYTAWAGGKPWDGNFVNDALRYWSSGTRAATWEDTRSYINGISWIVEWDSITNGWVNTGDWLGWLYKVYSPWVWSQNLDSWLYLPEANVTQSGGWLYIPR